MLNQELRYDIKLYGGMAAVWLIYWYSAQWMHTNGYLNDTDFMVITAVAVLAGSIIAALVFIVFILSPLIDLFHTTEQEHR